MKNKIIFETITISQEKAIKKGLKLSHLLLIDYLLQFFSSGYAKFVSKGKKDKYYYITLNKILSDLPILRIKKRRLQTLFHELEVAKIITRFSIKNSPNIYIKLNLSQIIP